MVRESMQQPVCTTGLEGSPAAVLYHEHAATILKYLRQQTRSWEDAEDVLVEVFLAALDSPSLLALSAHEQLAWLRRVAQHKGADHYRRFARRPMVALEPLVEILEEEEERSPEQVVLRQEERHRLQDAFRSLPVLQQEVVRLRFGEGLRCGQIGARLGKREEAVRKLLSRTLNQLRRLYGER
jgi:RNA polymerase sigma factor (sigma-70 family)